MRMYIAILPLLGLLATIDILFGAYLRSFGKRKNVGLKRLNRFLSILTLAAMVVAVLLNPVEYSVHSGNIYGMFFGLFTWFIIWYVPRAVLLVLQPVVWLARMFGAKAGRRFGRGSLWVYGLLTTLALFGCTAGRRLLQTRRVEVVSSEIPAGFDGYRIVQLSDLHLGTLGSPGRWRKLTERVNALEPDLVVFTGDLVNNFAAETLGWEPVLGGIAARDGKYAVMGNHDYGGYVRWRTRYDWWQNLAATRGFARRAGFQMLDNSHRLLARGGDTLALAGIENCGTPPFPCHGDLGRALHGLGSTPTLLLSHDADTWERFIGQSHTPIVLTLSGHTHGMQAGVRIGGWAWSPASLRYPKWQGLHQKDGKYLYINTGIGAVGFKGRIGIWPEITLIELKTKK